MKTAIITGAASGIGLALTQIYLEQGERVLMVDKNQSLLHQKKAAFNELYPQQLEAFVCDITNREQIKELTAYVQKTKLSIDWIYNNAGVIGPIGPIWELDLAAVAAVIQVNLFGMLNIIQGFVPLLLESRLPAHIVNMASLYAVCTSSQTAAYAMSKHAVLALSESLFFDLHDIELPIQVSVALPSFTDTGLLNPENNAATFQNSLHQYMSHSRPALEVARDIIHQVAQKKFYIVPDKEVKNYAEDRIKHLLLQDGPHGNDVQKIISSLYKREQKRKLSRQD
ncbi:MAG: short-chain dehydrogenase [Legionella sp. 40-6]|nr:SDR family NAD(P)-dependent oxidoreductase [Legionella sp.]OJY16268.1 MAG: short-chain dehydrogenase [Legionella sp. 40-6]